MAKDHHFSLIERDHCIWTNYIGCFHQSNMVPTTSSTLSQGHGLFSRNSHLQRFRTVVCLQLPAVMQQSHRRQEGSKHDLSMTYDYRDVPKGANPNHGTVLMCFRNFLFWVSGGFCWLNYCLGGGFKHFWFSHLPGELIQFDSYFSDGLKPPTSCVSFGESNLPQLILIATSRSLIDPSPLDPSTWFLGSHWGRTVVRIILSLLVKWSI